MAPDFYRLILAARAAKAAYDQEFAEKRSWTVGKDGESNYTRWARASEALACAVVAEEERLDASRPKLSFEQLAAGLLRFPDGRYHALHVFTDDLGCVERLGGQPTSMEPRTFEVDGKSFDLRMLPCGITRVSFSGDAAGATLEHEEAWQSETEGAVGYAAAGHLFGLLVGSLVGSGGKDSPRRVFPFEYVTSWQPYGYDGHGGGGLVRWVKQSLFPSPLLAAETGT